ncbi:uncharacterized protein LOC142796234 [Rhipicephalus microplus]|uniref:uncharacterized protein LOC142796234 n=1 Tax=Rhipicephalus microplus TaxID=6941 RepID=UPI003F6B86DD
MVESLDTCSTLLHKLDPWCFHGIFTDVLESKASRFQQRHLYRCVGLTLSRKRGAAAAPRKEQEPSKLPKLSSTGTARSLCGIENHCKECLISTLCCSFIAEAKLTTPEELHAVYCAYEGHISSMAVTFEIYSGAGASSSISPISTRHS